MAVYNLSHSRSQTTMPTSSAQPLSQSPRWSRTRLEEFHQRLLAKRGAPSNPSRVPLSQNVAGRGVARISNLLVPKSSSHQQTTKKPRGKRWRRSARPDPPLQLLSRRNVELRDRGPEDWTISRPVVLKPRDDRRQVTVDSAVAITPPTTRKSRL